MSGLHTWTRRHDPNVVKAKETLKHLPLSETGHGAEVPFPFIDRMFIKSRFDNRTINRAIKHAPVVSIPLDGLLSIQHSVKVPHVEHYLDHPDSRSKGHKNPKTGTPDDLPIVIQLDGKRAVWDGNHRLTSLVLLGKKKGEVRFVNLDELQSQAEQAGAQSDDGDQHAA